MKDIQTIERTCTCGRTRRSVCTHQWQVDYARSKQGQLCDTCLTGGYGNGIDRDDAKSEFEADNKERHEQQEADRKCRNM